MSAYVVSQALIAALVNAADADARQMHGQYSFYRGDDRHVLSRVGEESISEPDQWGRVTFTHSPESLGQLLLDECVRSVQYRYPDDSLEELPGIIGESRTVYTHRPALVAPLDALSLLSSYEYQSCEHPDWKQSIAYAFCDSLRRSLIHDLPGMRAAYEIEEELHV